MIKLVHARSTENGDSGRNGKAKPGDQTGNEVAITDWYSKPWGTMLRFPDKNTVDRVMDIAVKLANCDLVGYDQLGRNTLYQALKVYNFDVDRYIASGVKTETDCSAFVYACWCCVLSELRSDNNAPTTSNMVKFYKSHGFISYTNNKYLTNSGYLLNGDIEVKEGLHTAMVYDPGETLNPEVDTALDVIARDVIAGNWGNGEARKENLHKAVQNHVNDMLK